MEKIRFFAAALLFSIFFMSQVYSETIEEELLSKREVKLQNYYYQAKAGNRETKLELLQKIADEFDDEGYSSEDNVLVNLVAYLAEEGSLRKEFENNLLINDFPDVRRSSIEILSKLGGDEVRDILITILLNDQNESVRAEVCNAFANIGDNTSGDALNAIIYVYRKTYRPSQNFAFAIINVVKKLARPNTASYSSAIYILSEIQLGNFNRTVRKAAYDALNELSDYTPKS